ncbi:heavy-metal-associated domain-containing protein [Acidimicrobiaceae bacterium]|jgi:copper chaperone|uniref:Copper chaperone n=1 Tax=Candidatus Actinomarina minuta TaxID=1389454 RepID=S5DQT2_9ACTN|nr:copper chaperone [Candidatus Actinomarina minuta]MDC3103164.1 heavy-metal-associated domain-containing protein [Acidimicrobiaceae bacterium]|tara:strand:- start:1284 stop:1487 length:204 start_codon:yes stop_codon:yes gene_type:complete
MTIKFTVPEISCDHCKSTIIDTLSTVDVIELVEVSIETKDVTLKSSEEIDLDLVKSLLDEQGYTVVS